MEINFCILGLGYIGLPTACVIADSGYRVFGYDINQEVIDSINNSTPHIFEPGLKEILKKVRKKGLITAHKEIHLADVFIITVPSPTIEDKSGIPQPNIEYIIQAATSIGKVIKEGNLVILESTSPVGTTERIADIIESISKINKDKLHFAYCPERVLPGNILSELINNDRIIGGTTKKSSLLAKKTYQKFCKGEIYITTPRTAELVKIAENSFRDVNIAFANELSIVCEKLDINSFELIKLANKHPRVNILNPGCGVGGHCIAIDPWFIASQLKQDTKLIQTARKVNIQKTEWVVEKIIEKISFLKSELNKVPTVGCLGLTYKPDIDDVRESPALEIIESLIKNSHKVLVSEPNLKRHRKIEISSLDKVLDNSDLVVLLVGHKEFKSIDFSNINLLDFTGITEE